MDPKVVKVLIAIPNMGYAHSEAYGNRLLNFMQMGNLQTEQRTFHVMRKMLEENHPDLAKKVTDEFVKEHSQYMKYSQDEVFQFFFVNIGRIFTPAAREEAAKWAVQDEMDYIFFIDDDMIAPDDLFLKLYRHRDVADIVCPLAFTRNFPHKPVLYACKEGWDPIFRKDYYANEVIMNYPKDSLVRVDACGFGAALIKTWIFKKLEAPWFMSSEGTGEDILFCAPDGIVYGDFNDVAEKSNEAITHTGRKEKVDQHHKREYEGELVTIKPMYTEPLRLTPNHPVMVVSGSNHKWINAGDLKESDMLFFPRPILNDYVHTIDMTRYASGATITEEGIYFKRTHTNSSAIKPFVQIDEDIAKMFGWYVAEGNATNNNVVFSLNGNTETHIAKWLDNLFQSKFGTNAGCWSVNGSSIQITFTNAVLARFFKDNFGDGARNKRFPVWICDNKRFSGSVLRGLWDGDGCKTNQVLTTTSRMLCHQVKNLLAASDIISSIRIGSNEKRGKRRNYSIAIMANSRIKFGQLLGYELKDVHNKNRCNIMPFAKINDVAGWRVPIEKIGRESFKGIVYNLGVRNNNSYVFNGIAVHNCYKSKKVGAKVYMDTSIKLGHLGNPLVVTEEYVDKVRKQHDPLFEKRYPPYRKFGPSRAMTVLGDK